MTAEELRKTRKINRSGFVGTKDPMVQTSEGKMHEAHACAVALRMLKQAGISFRPQRITVGCIESHLYELIKELDEAPDSMEHKLIMIFEIAEFLKTPINLNTPIKWGAALPKFSPHDSQIRLRQHAQ